MPVVKVKYGKPSVIFDDASNRNAFIRAMLERGYIRFDANCTGYISRKNAGFVVPYEGRKGEGFVVHIPNMHYTSYHSIVYLVKPFQNTKATEVLTETSENK